MIIGEHMAEKQASFYRSQIQLAGGEQKKFETQAKNTNEIYSKSMSYNIFYSNVNVLSSHLLDNLPKPDIQRRFLKKNERELLQYNTYLQTAKVAEGAVSYYADISDMQSDFKMTTRKSVKEGRGVSWIVYDPIIGKDEQGQEIVADRQLTIDSLCYDEYRQSSGKAKKDVWWKARRHLLSKQDLKEKYNYDAEDDELNYTSGEEETAQKRAEVWELWDKTTKKRLVFLQSSVNDEFLSSTEDPYKLEKFFPCDDITWLNNGESLTPIPEYYIYNDKATRLNSLSKRSDKLDGSIKYVGTVSGSNSEKASSLLSGSSDGDVVSLNSSNPSGAENVNSLVSAVPVDGAVAIQNYFDAKKKILEQEIYGITGISDINRGVSDPRETAQAQKIKGVFGSLRFQDRQKMVQAHIRTIYQMLTEIICEHWDEKTLNEITSTNLPSQEEKQQVQALGQQAKAQGQELPSEMTDILEQPTWDDILGIMKNDKLRNYTIDVESTSTIFDDKEAESLAVRTAIELYTNMVQTATQLNNPSLIKGFMPLMRMALSSNKVGRANMMQIEEAVEGAYNELVKQQQNPQPSPEQLKAQAEQMKMQQDQADKQAKNQIDMAKLQNDSDKTALDAKKQADDFAIKQAELNQKQLVDSAMLANETRKTDIMQQEANRKEQELIAETTIAVKEIQTGVEAPTISGDVASVG